MAAIGAAARAAETRVEAAKQDSAVVQEAWEDSWASWVWWVVAVAAVACRVAKVIGAVVEPEARVAKEVTSVGRARFGGQGVVAMGRAGKCGTPSGNQRAGPSVASERSRDRAATGSCDARRE
eukprot:2332541-Prymnesium_polylepis.1